MKRPFLLIALGCLILFVVAGIVVGELLPYLWYQPRGFRSGRSVAHGASVWAILQNVSAVAGIVSFAIQIVQWGRGRRS